MFFEIGIPISLIINLIISFSVFGFFDIGSVGLFMDKLFGTPIIANMMPGGFPRITWVQFLFLFQLPFLLFQNLFTKENYFLKLLMHSPPLSFYLFREFFPKAN